MSAVRKFLHGPWPPINEDALKIVNRYSREFYIYGGRRWSANDDTESPTCDWNSDFFCLSLASFQWRCDNDSVREDPAFLSRSPFRNSVLRNRKDDHLKLPKLGTLPSIKYPAGAIFQSNDALRTTYLFIFGDSPLPSCQLPILLCLDMRMSIWGELQMTGHNRLKPGRAHAGMICVGDATAERFYLCVFGGEDDEDGSEITSYAVANLAEEIWFVKDKALPSDIGILGHKPTLLEVNGKVLIFKNQPETRTTEWKTAFLYDPASDTFEKVSAEDGSIVPPPSKTFGIQHSRDQLHANGHCSFIYSVWEDQMIVSRVAQGETAEVSCNLKTWKLQVSGERLVGAESLAGPTSVDVVGANPDAAHQSVVTKKGGPSALSTNQATQSSLRLEWTELEAGKLEAALDDTNKDLRIEEATALGDLWQPEFDARSELPRLILLGSCRGHQGEVRGELYSGYVLESLMPLKTKGFFSPTGEGEGEGEGVSDGSSSPSVATVSSLPDSPDVELATPAGPPASTSPSSQSLQSIEGGPVLVQEETDSDVEMSQMVIPESDDAEDDLTLAYPQETSTSADDGIDVFAEYCRFDSVAP